MGGTEILLKAYGQPLDTREYVPKLGAYTLSRASAVNAAFVVDGSLSAGSHEREYEDLHTDKYEDDTMTAAVMRYVIALGMVGALTMNPSLVRHRKEVGSRHTNLNMAQYCLPKENDSDQTKIYCWQDEGQIIWQE